MYKKYYVFVGKWYKKRYMLQKRLGHGGIGEVYLVTDENDNKYALKCSKDLISITKEYEFLKTNSKCSYFPRVYELDDFCDESGTKHFFLMEYINGYNLLSCLNRDEIDFYTKCGIICVLAKILSYINELGYVYSDLKMENIMIDKKSGRIKLVDYGSIVKIGDTIKEFSASYDRCSWEKGNRIADTAYQTFSIIMVFLFLIKRKVLSSDKRSLNSLLSGREYRRVSKNIRVFVNEVIDGRINNCNQIYEVFIHEIHKNAKFTEYRKLNLLIAVLSLCIIIVIYLIL